MGKFFVISQKCNLFLLDLFQVLGSILIGHVGWTYVELEVWPEIFEIVVVRKFIGYIRAERYRGLVSPASRDISNCVTTTSDH